MKKLLIVDDETCLTEVVAHAFEKAGYAVLTANDGAEGFVLALREMPDLIVSDYQMPIADGIQMATRLRNNASTRDIPIILLTARGHRLEAAVLEATNIRELMAKPFSARQLKAKVEEILAPAAGAAH